MKIWISIAGVLLSFLTFSQSTEYTVITEDQEIIWDMEWFGNDTIIFTELGGKVKLLDIQNEVIIELLEIADLARENQAGLMGLQLAPDFNTSKKVFLVYTIYDTDFNIYKRVSSFTYNPSSIKLESEIVLVDSILSKNANLGGRLLVDSNFIYLTSGDNQNENLAQDLNSTAGKILYYNLDGTPGNGNNSIFSFGHRNPQGICKTPNNNIFISEHGAFSDDEVNLLVAGSNFGWPLVSGPKVPQNQDLYDQYSIMEPLISFTPTIAPCGIDYYGNGPISSLQNSILVAALKDQALHVLSLNAYQDSIINNQRIDLAGLGRIRDVLIGENNRIFLATSNKDIYGEPKEGDDRIVEVFEPLFSNTTEVNYSKAELKIIYNGFQNTLSTNLNFSLYDTSGRLVLKGNAQPEETVLLNTFPKGIYILSGVHESLNPQKIIIY